MTKNVKIFPLNADKKLEVIIEEIGSTLNTELGKGTYSAYVTIIHAPGIGKQEDEDVEATSYRFTITPPELPEEDEDTFIGLLYKAISKDPHVGGAVIHAYSQKFAEFFAGAIANEEDEEDEKGTN
jgi:hypothetical protein